MSLVRKDNSLLPDEYYVCSFVAGLQDYVKNHLQCHRPRNLIETIWMARRIEQSHPLRSMTYTSFNRSNYPSPRDNGKLITNTGAKSYKQERGNRAKGVAQGNRTGKDYEKCRRCPEPWFPGHKCKLSEKQLFTATHGPPEEEEDEELEGKEVALEDTPPSSSEHQTKEALLQISMHAVHVTSSACNTFTLILDVGGVKAKTLVDSGSSATFVSPQFVVKAQCAVTNHNAVKIMIADGAIMWSDTLCKDCKYEIQRELFISDMRVLPLKVYDIILGADWIYTHNPIGLNLKTREFSVTKYRLKQVTFIDETLSGQNLLIDISHLLKLMRKGVIGAVICAQTSVQEVGRLNSVPEMIQTLQLQYSYVFMEPQQLPPNRDCDHAIPIVPGAKPVNQRPYKLPHYQKDAMEGLVEQLLKSKTIRPSVGPYSSPAILVKKKDGS